MIIDGTNFAASAAETWANEQIDDWCSWLHKTFCSRHPGKRAMNEKPCTRHTKPSSSFRWMHRFTTPGPVSRHLDAIGYEVTTGIGPDLMEGTRAAVSGMIDLLMRQHHISAIDAYLLCSVYADLRINEIVDQPNWIVSLYFPRIVFERGGLVRSDRVCAFLSGIAGAIKLPILSLAAWRSMLHPVCDRPASNGADSGYTSSGNCRSNGARGRPSRTLSNKPLHI